MSRKLAGFTSPYLPPELIWACGLIPVRLHPVRGLAAADGYLPRNFSVDARALLAGALERELPVDIAVFLDEDDTSRRLYDVWRAYAPIPCVDLVSLPRLDTPIAYERYAAALARLGEQLSALSGRPLTAPALASAVGLYNRQRALWRALRACWAAGWLSAADWYDLRWEALTEEPEAANASLAGALQDIRSARGDRVEPAGEERATAPARASGAGRSVEAEGVRLLALGGIEVPRPFLAFLENAGARVVAEDSEADEQILTGQIPESEVLEATGEIPALLRALRVLATAYLGKPPGPRPAQLPQRLAAVARLTEERRVRGAVAVYPKFADALLAEFVALEELFRGRGIPALLLENDGESGFSGQQRTRLEAFLEVLA